MPQMLYTRYFLEAQGYRIDKNILYQDNTSEMLLENNTKKSSTKNTKHINVRYYFIKDRVDTGDVVIEHCPTEKMLGGHFIKPLQGALFRKFRAEIIKRVSRINCITRLNLDAHRSVFRIVSKLEGKIVLWSAQIL